jgi:hypothetical protein
MNAYDRLVAAWTKAGYPEEYIPKAQFQTVAEAVQAAFLAGEEDFLMVGWAKAGVDFPFAPTHPRYQAMTEAYEELGE